MPAGRFAPTPSGDLHLGNLRTALAAWLFARSSNSAFYLRIDDLVPDSDRPGVASRQLDDLRTLGLDWDGAAFHQRDNVLAYHDAIDQLIENGLTYRCYCTRREIQEAASAPQGLAPQGAYPGTCRELSASDCANLEQSGRQPALRLRANSELVSVVDRLCGVVEVSVDDMVLRRNDGVPAYNLAVIVDDAMQSVEEVVRGDDLLASTPRQVYLARLLGLAEPIFAHVPLALAQDGTRLAKRNGAVTLSDRMALGESPNQVLGHLAASLHLAEPGESASPKTLLERFDPATLPSDPWIVDLQSLRLT
ncbi:MAG: tRNA glutamyl-Q(34) synthetase GluQRS [Actinomycetes bacterium]